MATSEATPVRPIRIAVLGAGTVGQGFLRLLGDHQDLVAAQAGGPIEVVGALVRNRRRKRDTGILDVALTSQPEKLLDDPNVDIVIELLGGTTHALDYVRSALKAGKSVVTANKALIAAHGKILWADAEKSGAALRFEAAVAGGIPLVRTLGVGMASESIEGISAILNGTSNFILGAMATGKDYRSALTEAQALGFAEADPSLDVGGQDAADKLAILAGLAFGTEVGRDKVFTKGITELLPCDFSDADALDANLRLIAHAQRIPAPQRGKSKETLDLWVEPVMISRRHPLAHVFGADNGVAIRSAALGRTLLQGPGAGALPTGSAVLADVVDVARTLRSDARAFVPQAWRKGVPPLAEGESLGAYHIRLQVQERPGVLAEITKVLAKQKISLRTVTQTESEGARASAEDGVGIVMTTHQTHRAAMQKAMAALQKLDSMLARPRTMRMIPG